MATPDLNDTHECSDWLIFTAQRYPTAYRNIWNFCIRNPPQFIVEPRSTQVGPREPRSNQIEPRDAFGSPLVSRSSPPAAAEAPKSALDPAVQPEQSVDPGDVITVDTPTEDLINLDDPLEPTPASPPSGTETPMAISPDQPADVRPKVKSVVVDTHERRPRSHSRRRSDQPRCSPTREPKLLRPRLLPFEAIRPDQLKCGMTSQESRQRVLHFKGEKSLHEDNAQWTVDSLDPSMQVGFKDANEIKFNARDAAGHPAQPILDAEPQLFNNILVYRCRPAALTRVRLEITGQYVWIATSLAVNHRGRDSTFLHALRHNPANTGTCVKFLQECEFVCPTNRIWITLLDIYNVPDGWCYVQIKQWLLKLQSGHQNFDNFKVGRCPHMECRSCVIVIDGGHFCKALKDKWTPNHVPRNRLDHARYLLRSTASWVIHNVNLPRVKAKVAKHR